MPAAATRRTSHARMEAPLVYLAHQLGDPADFIFLVLLQAAAGVREGNEEC
jgi:hypothetical protein